jgi:hypothetical protein
VTVRMPQSVSQMLHVPLEPIGCIHHSSHKG